MMRGLESLYTEDGGGGYYDEYYDGFAGPTAAPPPPPAAPAPTFTSSGAPGYMSVEDWARQYDPTLLGRMRNRTVLDPEWSGHGGNTIQDLHVADLLENAGLMRTLGLGPEDYSRTGERYESDNLIESQTTLSDRARELLGGYATSAYDYGDGMSVGLVRDPSGNVIGITAPNKSDRNWLDDVADIAIPLMIGIGTGGLGTALGGAMGLTGAAGTAFAGAMRGLGSSALSGGDMLQGALRGGLSGMLAPTIGDLASSAGQAVGGGEVGDAVSRALRGAGRAALTGGDIGAGAVAGGLGSLTSSVLDPLNLPQGVENTLSSALAASLLDNDPRRAFMNTALQEILAPAAPSAETPRARPSEEVDWASMYAQPSVIPGYMDPDGYYVHETSIVPEAQSSYPVQDFGADAITPGNLASFNRNLQDIYDNRGGFTSQWQTAGSDRIMVQDDGSAIGLNTETGEVYGLEADQTQRMIDAGLLNTEQSGYADAINTAMALTASPSRPASPTPAPRPATPAPTAPAPAPTAPSPTSSGGLDLGALMAIMGAMGGAGAPSPSEPQVADVGVKSPFGNILDSLGA